MIFQVENVLFVNSVNISGKRLMVNSQIRVKFEF